MSKLLIFSICLLTLFLSNEIKAQSTSNLRKVHIIGCAKAKTQEDRRLCNAVMTPGDRLDYSTFKEFEITSRQVDLNKDGRFETIAWISSWGGTSGQPLNVLSKRTGRYRKLWTDNNTTGWTPIILLRTKHHGWSDLAFLVAGGGIDPYFVILRNNGRSYRISGTVKTSETIAPNFTLRETYWITRYPRSTFIEWTSPFTRAPVRTTSTTSGTTGHE